MDGKAASAGVNRTRSGHQQGTTERHAGIRRALATKATTAHRDRGFR
jgi:hypothetical protein